MKHGIIREIGFYTVRITECPAGGWDINGSDWFQTAAEALTFVHAEQKQAVELDHRSRAALVEWMPISRIGRIVVSALVER